MDSNELVTVYTVTNPVEAEIIKNALHGEGIRCFLEGENQAGEAGLGIMEVKVQVPAPDADRAGRFLQAHERGGKVRATQAANETPREVGNEGAWLQTSSRSFSGTHKKWR